MDESNYKWLFWLVIIVAFILLIAGLCYLFPSEGSASTQEGSSTQTSPDGSACQDPTSTGWWLVGISIVVFIIAGVMYSKKNKMIKKTEMTTVTTTKTPKSAKPLKSVVNTEYSDDELTL